MIEKLLTAREVADILRVRTKTVGRWIREGKLVATSTIGGHHRIPESEVERVLTEGQR